MALLLAHQPAAHGFLPSSRSIQRLFLHFHAITPTFSFWGQQHGFLLSLKQAQTPARRVLGRPMLWARPNLALNPARFARSDPGASAWPGLASFVRRARPKPILKLIWSSFGLSPRMVLQLLMNGVIAYSAPFGPWISAIIGSIQLSRLPVHAITPVLSLWARSPGFPLPHLCRRNSASCALGWVPTSWRA